MLTINKEFMDNMPIALVVTDSKGIILKMNQSAINILKGVNISSGNSIHDISSRFHINSLSEGHKIHTCCIDGFTIGVNVHKVNYEDKSLCYLYVFDDLKYKKDELDIIFNCIDDVVLIVNKDKIVERLNNAFYKLTGMDGNLYIGRSIYALKDEGVMRESVILNVFENKRPVIMNVKYKNGSTVMYTGIPIFNKDKEVIKVIATGRNITKLVNLETKLKRTEEQKEEYLKKLKRLEICLAENDVIYSSDKMRQVLEIAFKVAKTDSSVFIKGDSGVGKEIIAKFIHKNSKRNNKPFVAINCAAIPSELLESEFFGYDEGAFTGAKKGLFEEANGGTIFLDEIGELTVQMQTKLLRVLQENKIMRVGGNKSIPINVRYVCATNLSKEQLSNNLKFRQDLYYRLSVIPITIPSLCDRRDDILPLVYHFLGFYNNKYNRNIKFNKKVMKLLYNYDWPGNVRELKNVVERLVILAEENVVNEIEFNMVTQLEQHGDDQSEKPNILITRLMDLNEAHRIVDEIMIGKALKKYGTIIKAAKVLGIDPSTIHRKLKKGYITIR